MQFAGGDEEGGSFTKIGEKIADELSAKSIQPKKTDFGAIIKLDGKKILVDGWMQFPFNL